MLGQDCGREDISQPSPLIKEPERHRLTHTEVQEVIMFRRVILTITIKHATLVNVGSLDC